MEEGGTMADDLTKVGCRSMGKGRWELLKHILADTLELPPAERTAFIERATRGDDELLRQAREFLGRETDVFEQFADFAAHRLQADQSADENGRRIGAYVVVRELGRGGMGAVYLAGRADGVFEKQVAIKVLKRGTDTDEILRRFHAERRMLARLDHPNIARLLDAGTTDDGLPYFIMEWIDGEPITHFAAKAQLTVPQRLALFLKICSAVEQAHKHQIVHRDLKPRNVLVGADGEPKLLDFGIAKLLSDEQQPLHVTSVAERRLTPISAAPEQTRGERVTYASDVYSLGVLLYELLAGRSPYDFDTAYPSPEEITAAICSQDPPPASARVAEPDTRARVRCVDSIIARAMEKTPAARYTSVAEMARDIRCCLAGEPLHRTSFAARTAGTILRTGARLRQHRRWAFAAAVLLLGVGIALAWHLRRVAPPPDAETVIAVLPFTVTGGSGESSYLVEGIQDNLLTDLEQVERLTVVSRNAIARVLERTKDVRQLGSLLDARYVVEGTVERSDRRVRVNARLIDSRADRQIWAQRYDRVADDLFTIEAEIAERIAHALDRALQPDVKAALRERPTADAEAYDLYLRARSCIHEGGTPQTRDNYLRAAHLLEAAVARDPNFALAYCSLSEAHLGVYRHMPDGTTNRLPLAKAAAETALQLAPNLPDAHIALARYYYRTADFERALAELAPAAQSGQAEFYRLASLAERRLGRWSDAVKDGEKAFAIDPTDPLVAQVLMRTYMGLRRFSDAEHVAERAKTVLHGVAAVPLTILQAQSQLAAGRIEDAKATVDSVPPDAFGGDFLRLNIATYQRDFETAKRLLASARPDPIAGQPLLAITAAVVARRSGDVAAARSHFIAARRELETLLSAQPDEPALLSQLGIAYAGLGRIDEAVQKCQLAIEVAPRAQNPTTVPIHELALALVETWAGEREAAITRLAALVKLPGGASYGDLRFNPVWDELRSDPRFAAILSEVARPVSLPGGIAPPALSAALQHPPDAAALP
ncbi:MAG: FlgO family outer membrane protein [Verrucomicrobiota bacterium]|nr:FlgO family outer membrane protein [Verrucomicrobiota bacterium]